jgi:NADPH-dependent 2,4-dienoyl-CoA reductase/sulfur reductase-like enzyme
MAHFDVRDRLDRIRAPLLYVLSRTDRLVPPTLGPTVMALLGQARVDARYHEIDSAHGHAASSTDAQKWARLCCASSSRASTRTAHEPGDSVNHLAQESGEPGRASTREETPVLIAGAGPAGLAMSILLSRKGIRHTVAEKREQIGTLPRARHQRAQR